MPRWRESLGGRLGPALRRARAELGQWSGRHTRERQRLDGHHAAVLMYHRVLPLERARALEVEPGMFVTPETFARQLDWLAESFAVLPLHELLARWEAGEPFPDGACALSFDDGWLDNAQYAFPALRARGLPATIFLVSRRVGTRGAFWPDELARRLAALPARESADIAAALGAGPGPPRDAILARWKSLAEDERADALEQLREMTPRVVLYDERELLDWEEIGSLARGGIDFECHGATHALLTSLPAAAAARELAECLEALRARGHARHGLLAYPNGAHDASVRKLAREAGFRAAFSTCRGVVGPDSDRLELPRIGLHQDISGSRAEFLRVVPGSGLARR